MSNIGCIMSGIALLMALRNKYNGLSADPDGKASTEYFGKYSIVVSVVTGGLLLLAVWGVIALAGSFHTASVGELAMGAFIALTVILCIFLLAEYILGGFMGVVYQLRCNRRPISYIALAVFTVVSAAVIVGLIFIVRS